MVETRVFLPCRLGFSLVGLNTKQFWGSWCLGALQPYPASVFRGVSVILSEEKEKRPTKKVNARGLPYASSLIGYDNSGAWVVVELVDGFLSPALTALYLGKEFGVVAWTERVWSTYHITIHNGIVSETRAWLQARLRCTYLMWFRIR